MTYEQAVQALKKADDVRRSLRAALREAGITLPSLGVDPASCAGPAPRPLIDLGRCNVRTALELAAALQPGAAPEQKR